MPLLTAEKLDGKGAVTRTLPLCRYPQYPKYTGPANDAAAAKLAASYPVRRPEMREKVEEIWN